MTDLIKKFDADYNIRECIKCGRIKYITVKYVVQPERAKLIVTCGECGYSYDMLPKYQDPPTRKAKYDDDDDDEDS